MATSPAPRIRRRYRGRDVLGWWTETGFYEQRRAELEDPAILRSMSRPDPGALAPSTSCRKVGR